MQTVLLAEYLDEVLVVIEEEWDLEVGTRRQPTLKNIKTYNMKCAIYDLASAWKDMKITSLSN